MGHHVMADYFLALRGGLIVDVVNVLLHLGYLIVCYVEPKLLFAFCEGYPQLAPCGKLGIVGENMLHFLARIAFAERIFISV